MLRLRIRHLDKRTLHFARQQTVKTWARRFPVLGDREFVPTEAHG
jgi:hypothetical protein